MSPGLPHSASRASKFTAGYGLVIGSGSSTLLDGGWIERNVVYNTFGLFDVNEGVYGWDPWIPARSATRLREADLDILSKLSKQGLKWRLEPEAFTGREIGREDDLLDFPVGCAVDIEVARQPSA